MDVSNTTIAVVGALTLLRRFIAVILTGMAASVVPGAALDRPSRLTDDRGAANTRSGREERAHRTELEADAAPSADDRE
jgi:hypothetical protein